VRRTDPFARPGAKADSGGAEAPGAFMIRLRVGYEIVLACPQPTPLLLTLHIHGSRAADLVRPDTLFTDPPVPQASYLDSFGNRCTRLVAPAGELRLSADALLDDPGAPDPWVPSAREVAVPELPDEVLLFLLGSRYCETDRLMQTAWDLFSGTPPGWARVQAICDFVHGHVRFGYEHARPTKTAFDVLQDGTGVCRDFAHLAVALCRCMNIPARYCTGYLSDVGVAPPHAPGDFAAWFEARLDGGWYVFDPRNHQRRIGRILIARGRDAADVAISNSFGPSELRAFRVWADPE
jgi:transglutaminase-like putative cysteine protease